MRRGAVDNTAMIDVYAVTWAGKNTPVTLYINMYRGGKLLAPMGFTGARSQGARGRALAAKPLLL
ncbi:hypothetical protein BEN48_00750 [Hymenobacter glacialis]|uniref:Uncharacterized protein n=1 Tax=Hymenobacter glacialis TaxID=1908236 RepID=A0A1G1T7R5_9BACT|nr:hypothetical protein BEN48_00750 [Hymenobacter glacialis]